MDRSHIPYFSQNFTRHVLITDKEDFFPLAAQFTSEIQSMVVHKRKHVQFSPAQHNPSDTVHKTRAESRHRSASCDVEGENLRYIKEELDRQQFKKGQIRHVFERIFSEKHSDNGKKRLENGYDCVFFIY